MNDALGSVAHSFIEPADKPLELDYATTITPRAPIKAIVDGKELTEVPQDLFIPPDALEVLLDSFTGPLDLLLYLIRKQNLDILNIPMVSITQQYLQYIQLMEYNRMELASDYLLMASVLIEIKSRLLLPVIPNLDESEEEDPRMALVRRLLAYEQMKQAAELLDALPRQDRDNFIIHKVPDLIKKIIVYPEVSLLDLVDAMLAVEKKGAHHAHHEITREIMSVRDRMTQVLLLLQEHHMIEFKALFQIEEGRQGLVVSLLAILELARQSLVIITQTKPFAPIHLRAA